MSARARDLALAAGVGASIAAYTLVDREGVRHAAPVPYLWLVLVGPALRLRGGDGAAQGGAALRAEVGLASLFAAVGHHRRLRPARWPRCASPGRGGRRVRETSVVIAVLLAAVVLREHVGRAGVAARSS